MIPYLFHKFLYTILVLLGVVTATFFINRVLPGDPARVMLGQRADEQSVLALRKQLGLDRPILVQYATFLREAAQGDFGESFTTNRDVMETILERFPATAILALLSVSFSAIFGVLFGVMASLRPNSILDASLMGTALLGISLPSFVFGLLCLLFFGVFLKLLPISGYIDQGISHIVLPAFTLALRPLSIIARVTRSSMLDVMTQDYIRTAKAKGLTHTRIVVRHALRNALNPVITTISSWVAGLLAGAYFVEYIFNWPGIGTASIDAILKLDYPMIQGVVLFSAVVFVFVNFAVDVFYAFVDPKVKIS